MKEVNWLLEQRPMVVDVKVRDKVFHMVEPTVQDRDKLDAVLSKMDLDTLEIRTPLLQATLCNSDGQKVASDKNFDNVPADLVEPLIDKAKELFGISEDPTDGETD